MAANQEFEIIEIVVNVLLDGKLHFSQEAIERYLQEKTYFYKHRNTYNCCRCNSCIVKSKGANISRSDPVIVNIVKDMQSKACANDSVLLVYQVLKDYYKIYTKRGVNYVEFCNSKNKGGDLQRASELLTGLKSENYYKLCDLKDKMFFQANGFWPNLWDYDGLC
jgi:hypothetical protein